MREVLSLSYDAAAAALLVTASAVKPSEHVPGAYVRQLGEADPQTAFSLDELPPEHEEAFRSLLVWLSEETAARHAAAAAAPEEVARRAAAVAGAEYELRVKEEAAKKTLADLDAEIEKRRTELARPAAGSD